MRLVLLKSAQIANQAGYYFANHRWHKVSEGKPIPKGAPVAAHPEAAGKHEPVKHFSDDEWAQLKLPETNVNAPSYNKLLDKLKQMSEAGNITGILGMQFGTNTYGKKAAIIANHLLGLHGSEHQVAAGQKAGEHAAVKVAPKAEEPASAEQKPEVKSEPESGAKSGAEPAEQPSDLAVPEFEEGKKAKGVKAFYDKAAEKIIAAAKSGDVAALQAMPNAEQKSWQGKTGNSKKLIALHEQALAYAGAAKPAEQEKPKEAPVAKQEAKTAEPKLTPKGLLIGDSGYAKTYANKTQAQKAADKLTAQGYSAHVVGKHPFFVKVEQDKPATETKKDEALNAAIDHLKEDAKQGDLPKAEQKEDQALVDKLEAAVEQPATSDKPANASPASDKLSQIPWDKMKIPDTNSNAKQHNSTVDKIKEMAQAGDVAGLQALYDKKSGSKQTYIKKQALLAQTALAALEEAKDAAPEQAKDEPQASEPSTGGKPVKPQIKTYDAVADNIESALNSGNKPQLESLVQMTAQLKGVNEDGTKVHEYAVDALSYLQDQEEQSSNQAGTDTENDGPQEGETKQGADGTLVFQNGRWHKQGDNKAAEKPAPAGPADVEIPEFNGPNATHNAWLKKAAEALKEKVVAEGKDGLKQPLTNHKNGTVTVKIAGVHVGKASVTSSNPALASFAQFVDELKSSVSKKPKKAKPAPKAEPVKSKQFNAIESMDSWTQTGGQGGSNPGGKFKDENGTEWYCKFPESEDVAKSEVLAAKLYAAAGIEGQDAKFVTKNGKLGIASKWQTVNKASPKDLADAPGVLDGFGMDAWLANWDVVGLGFDNLQLNEKGKAVRVDAGGSLMYRAQGGKKAFGDHVTELDSLRDPKINPQAAAVFGKMSDADITASIEKVLKISDSKIAQLVQQFGPGSEQEKQALIKTLIARKQNLAEKFPKAAQAVKKAKFDPSKVSAPPDFLNWGGPGMPGPSSKQFVNEANNVAVQHIFAAAKTGDIKAVEALQEPIYNKTTGEVTGQSPVLEHPSQHVKGYAKQVINEIDYQLNPPKKFRLGGDHPLNALNASYPAAKGAKDVKKLGEFIVLGEPGTIDVESLGMPKITYAGGKLTQHTYVKQAHQAVEKMPQTQLQAVQAYTGSSYKSMNSSLWSGNPNGQAKAAAEALHTLAHDIAPGTVLSRKISLGASDSSQLIKSVGKVLQEPAIMSTSIRPSSWSGNIHLKLHVGPGVKGLWVGNGSMPGGGALSHHSGEDEMILPPNTRLLILSVKQGGATDSDGFGSSAKHVIEALVLPSEGY